MVAFSFLRTVPVIIGLSAVLAFGCSGPEPEAEIRGPGGDGGSGGTGGSGGSGGDNGSGSSQLIGPEGGAVTGEQGVTVTIPAGALASDTTIAANVVDASDLPAPPSGMTAAGPFVALTPHGTQFAMPVEVTLPYTSSSSRLTVLRIDDESDTTWEQLTGASFDGGTATVGLSRFSILAVAAPDSGGTGGAGGGGGQFNQCAEYRRIIVSPTTQSTGGDPVDVQVWCYDPDGAIDSPLAAILFVTVASVAADPDPSTWVNCGLNTDFQFPPVPQACPHQDLPIPTVVGSESTDIDLFCNIGDDGTGYPGTQCVVLVSVSDDGFAAGGTDPFGCDGTRDHSYIGVPVFCQCNSVCQTFDP